MYSQLFSTIAPVIAVVSVGYLWAKLKKPYNIQFVSDLVVHLGGPCLTIASLVPVALDIRALMQLFIASILIMIAVGLVAGVALRLTRQSISTYLPAMVFSNSGNMGLPLCLFAFGEKGLAFAVAYYTAASIFMFTCGPIIARGHADEGFSGVVKHPIIISVVIALVIKGFAISIPLWLMRPIVLISDITIPLMLLTLGVSLSQLKVSNIPRSVVFGAIRIGLGFLMGLLVVWGLGTTGTARGVILIQSAMPVAVFNYIFAVQYNRSPEQVAGIVVFSTLISFFTLPLLLSFVM